MNITPEIISYVAAVLTTGSFLPQAVKTVRTRDTQSLSLGMYGIFTTGVFLWLIYGICLADKAIIFANAVTFVLAGAILTYKIYNTLSSKE